MLRDGAGGGKRVSAATLVGPVAGELPPLVMVRDGEDALDAVLAANGYVVVDPVVVYAGPCVGMETDAAAHWPPSDAARAVWAQGGIGPERVAVMERVKGPRTVIANEAGAAFVAIAGDTAMLHALEVTPQFRRRGAARQILGAASAWAAEQGASVFSLVVTEGNVPARALYAALGMDVVARYHYRQKA